MQRAQPTKRWPADSALSAHRDVGHTHTQDLKHKTLVTLASDVAQLVHCVCLFAARKLMSLG